MYGPTPNVKHCQCHVSLWQQVGQFMKQGRDLVLRVVPLAEGDCLSCKLIGSGVMWGAALFVLFSYSKAKERFTGYRRPLFAVQALSLATGKNNPHPDIISFSCLILHILIVSVSFTSFSFFD